MTNPLSKIYDFVDDGLMYFANKAVQGYNYTFGGTKADLANKMLFVAPILESIGYLNWGVAPLATPIMLLNSHLDQKKNKQIEKLEISSAESDCQNIEVNHYKKSTASVFGPMFILTGTFISLPFDVRNNGVLIPDETYTNLALGIGNIIRGSSFYIMRADYLPPRKSVFKRAGERLTEIIKEIELNPPIPIPQPIPVRVR